MKKNKLPLALGFVALFSVCSCATVSQVARNIEPEADRILKTMSEKLAGARHFSITATRSIDSELVEGTKVKENAKIVVAVSRPSGIRGWSRNKSGLRELYYDGSEFTIWDKANNTYASVPAPPTIDETIDAIEEKWGTHPPLADLLVSDPYASLTRGVEAGKLVGSESVAGTPCDHLSFSQSNIDWQIWIGKSDSLPRRFVITFKDGEGRPELRADIHSWDLKTTYGAGYFSPKIGQGAVKIEMIPTN